MRAVIQRVNRASVTVEGDRISSIGPGLLTLLGVQEGDEEKHADWLMRKILNLRIFEDQDGKMNRSLIDCGGEHLIVSQFTLFADVSRGNRPSFVHAAKPEIARRIYDYALGASRALGVKTEGGRFQASMQVELENDGPVTILLDHQL